LNQRASCQARIAARQSYGGRMLVAVGAAPRGRVFGPGDTRRDARTSDAVRAGDEGSRPGRDASVCRQRAPHRADLCPSSTGIDGSATPPRQYRRHRRQAAHRPRPAPAAPSGSRTDSPRPRLQAVPVRGVHRACHSPALPPPRLTGRRSTDAWGRLSGVHFHISAPRPSRHPGRARPGATTPNHHQPAVFDRDPGKLATAATRSAGDCDVRTV